MPGNSGAKKDTPMAAASHWRFWAALSAVFAALTAVFAKAGVQDVDSDLATLQRTAFILVLLATFVLAAGNLLPDA